MPRTLHALKTDLLFNLSRALNRSLTPPDWVSINLTLRCNLRCTMCTTCYPVEDELSTQEVLDIIDQVALWGVNILNPLGGEPFMRADLVEILRYACSKDFYITLTTNGTLITPTLARELAQIAYDRLHFNLSLDGFLEVHDRIRGPGAYERALAGYRALREADAAAGNPPRKVLVNCVLHNQNLDTLPLFLDHCRALGFQGLQLLSLFRPAGDVLTPGLAPLWIPPERLPALDRLIDALQAFKRASDPQRFALTNGDRQLEVMKRYYRGDLPPRDAPCFAGWKELYIHADGRAIMCDGALDFLNGAFGSVRNQTLRQLWASPALRARREVVKACTRPCLQDCYLRGSSDALLPVLEETAQRLRQTAREKLALRLPRRTQEAVPGSQLTLELTDVADLCPAHETLRAPERFAQLTSSLPVPFDRAWDDPFLYYEWRNRGYLQFNRGFMGLELARTMLPSLERAGRVFEELRLGWRGDPLLHPEFVPFFRYLLERYRSRPSFRALRVDTHASLLNTEYVDLALEATDLPQTWLVSLDAASRETYAQIQGRDLWDQVLARLHYLFSRKAQLKASHLRVVLGFTVLPGNVQEAVAFRDFWLERLRGLGLLEPALVVGALPEGLPTSNLPDMLYYRRQEAHNFLDQLAARGLLGQVAVALGREGAELERPVSHPLRCACPFLTPTVSWDGKVTVCGRDRFLELRVGEVTTEGLAEVWWEKGTSREIREASRRGDLLSRLPCRDCRYPLSPAAPRWRDGLG